MEESNFNNKHKSGMKIDKSKNKQESSIQITAEQIIRASHEYIADDLEITDTIFDTQEELNEYKAKKRKRFEDYTQRNRYNISAWFKYADWEEHLKEFKRARNIYERAIEVDYKNISLWLRYAEMEMKSKNINHARNVWERAIKLLPRHDQLWYKYAYMEELLGNYLGAREIFKAWMTWKPDELAWMNFAKFEERMGEVNKAREVLYKFIEVHNEISSYVKVAKFEEKHENLLSARKIYEAALCDLGEKALNEEYFISFAKFEIKMKEYERARVLLKYGLENITKLKKVHNDIVENCEESYTQYAKKLHAFYVNFEKMYGNDNNLEIIVAIKRRKVYEERLIENPYDYDNWFSYIYLEESVLAITSNQYEKDKIIMKIRDLYERAISKMPEIQNKLNWKRYVYLWISYALFEELTMKDMTKTDHIYKKLIEIIPHREFSFSKVWIFYAYFLIRCDKLDKTRLLFGKSIGICPNEKIFKAYIELELQLGNLDKCRKLFEKCIQCFPYSSKVWVKYAEFEESLEENERSRAILEAGINQDLNMPELIWKSYINIEIESGNKNAVRQLYYRLLEKTDNIKIWLSYIKFEEDEEEFNKARELYTKAYNYYKTNNNPENREEILLSWKEFEYKTQYLENDYNPENIIKVERLLPTKIKKLKEENNQTIEYFEYIFPEDNVKPNNFKLLEYAKQWEKEKIKENR